MQPEQSNTPSTEVQAPDAAAPESVSDKPAGDSPSGSWWSRLFSRGPASEQDADTASEDQPTESAASKTLSLTEDELERRIKSETDRREAKRAQEAKAARRRELRDKDPWAYAEEERKDEELNQSTGQLNNFVVSIAQNYDRASIDPIVELLPETERQRILSLDGVGSGLDGRKLLVTESLRALERHWRSEGAKEAESKLRKNQTFRKQIWSEFRGQTTEPELLPGRASSTADETISGLLRTHYGLGR